MRSIFSNNNVFMRRTFVTVFIIVLAKVLDIFYVIPFYGLVGDIPGALYGYSYTIYLLFMSWSSVGIPIAISRMVSEYQKLGYYNAKKRLFLLSKQFMFLLGLICFILINIFAPSISNSILGNFHSSITASDITLSIRTISSALLVTPIFFVYQGYFEGHRFTNPISVSQAISQILRVLVIVLGSYLSLKVFKMSIVKSVIVATFGVMIGALGGYLYLFFIKYKNKQKFNEKARSVNEPIITNRIIIKKLVVYAIPVILIDLFINMYNYIDVVSVVKGLVNYAKFKVDDAVTIMGMFTLWAAKFNTIIISIAVGIVSVLIPGLSQSILKKNENECSKKLNQAYEMVLFLIIPITIIISFLAKPIWTLFYGASLYGPNVLSYYIFVGLIIGILMLTISIIQVYKDYKTIFISLGVGLILKILLNVNLISAFYKMGIPAYYGVITASVIGYFTSFVIAVVMLNKKIKINYEDLIKYFIDILCGSVLMTFVLFLLKFIIPVYSDIRIVNLLIILLYVVVGSIVYLLFMYKTGTIRHIFGKKIGRNKK